MNEFYKGYWMITNRCTLRCSYCVLENSSSQIKAELDLENKKELLSHLYNKLGFRRLTISGGEATIIGKHPPKEFIEFMQFIKNFKSSDKNKNLEIELYTNGTLIDEKVAKEMSGVVDTVAVTIDGTKNSFLSEIGRNFAKYQNYYDNITHVCKLLIDNGIEIKLHSVISQKNYLTFSQQVKNILDSIEQNAGSISCWKFYQYMSYDDPIRDKAHHIPPASYQTFKEEVEAAIGHRNVRLHFKDNVEMNDSLFNILSYGNAQYMRRDDSWSTSQRTRDLRSYNSMLELFAQHDIDEKRFKKFHQINK